MSDDYTPDTKTVRECFIDGAAGEFIEVDFKRWLERVKSEAKAGSLPEGAKWFPDEGGIQWQGKVYFPADYVLTRSDIAKLRAEAKAEQAEADAQIAEQWEHDDLDCETCEDVREIAAAIRAAADNEDRPAKCLSCNELAVDSGEGRFCGYCQDHEGTCINDHCLTCGATT